MNPGHPRRAGFRLAGLWLLFFFLGTASASHSDPWANFDNPWFNQVGVPEGLPHSISTAIAQDSRGLIWVGTMGGLVRYDGYRLQVFGGGSDSRFGLPDTYVRNLLALPYGGLLVGTNAGGLARFDPVDNSFHAYPLGNDELTDSKVYGLADDHAGGGVWVATEAGLSHLDLLTDSLRRVPTPGIKATRNFSVRQDRAGNLWLGNNNGLYVRYVGADAFTRVTSPDTTVSRVLNNQIWAIRQDRAGRIWVGSVQAGAAYLDMDGHWHGVPGFSGYADNARHPTVRDFLETATDTMWIATDGNGLIEYAVGSTHTRSISHDPALPSSLPGNSVRALLLDHAGNRWAATDLGIARYNPNARTAFSVLPSPLAGRTLADNNVHGIFVGSRDRVWLGLGNGHIDLIDLHAGALRHLHLGGNQAQREVRAFAETADGSIWVGTQGVSRIHPDTLAIEDSIVPALRDKPVLSLLADGAHLMIGTYDGVYRYDTRTQSLAHLSNQPGDPTSLLSNTVRQIAKVDDHWWYGTARGISIATDSASTRGFINLFHRPYDAASLPQDYIGSITSDPHGRVWVSTFGGLAVVEPPSAGIAYAFHTIGLANGLSSDKVNAALADDAGKIWASLSNGIAVIDADTHTVRNLGTRDGLHISSYVNIAAGRVPSGELLFGGIGGLTVIRPHWQGQPFDAAPLAVTQIVVNGVPMPLGTLPEEKQAITLGPHERSLRLDFALLDYQSPKETFYSYRMDGLDDDWTELPRGSLPSAIYTTLPHGRYRLQLRAVTHGMQPRTVESEVRVVILPRWYETIASRIAAALLLIGLLVLLVHLRTLYLNRQARQLQRQIDEHTRDLLAANLRLDTLASTDGLTGVYNRRRFLELAGDERERTGDGSACIALFDLDRFKQINDTYGHLAGDEVIRRAIDVIKQHCRRGDLLGRYGGEEFVLCLPGTTAPIARDVASRICTVLAETDIQHDGQRIAVTISAGIAALRPGESIEQWLSRADGALYTAKRSGRNQSVTAP